MIVSLHFLRFFIYCFFFAGSILSSEDDFWNPEQYRESSSMQKRWIQQLLKKAQLSNFNKLLDVGSGDGIITASLASERPDGEVLGVDLSAKMVAFAKKSFPREKYKNINFVERDAENL